MGPNPRNTAHTDLFSIKYENDLALSPVMFQFKRLCIANLSYSPWIRLKLFNKLLHIGSLQAMYKEEDGQFYYTLGLFCVGAGDGGEMDVMGGRWFQADTPHHTNDCGGQNQTCEFTVGDKFDIKCEGYLPSSEWSRGKKGDCSQDVTEIQYEVSDSTTAYYWGALPAPPPPTGNVRDEQQCVRLFSQN